MTGSNRNGLAIVVGKMVAAVVMGILVQSAAGQANLFKNGDFGDGLTDWKSQGNVTVGMFQAVVADTGGDAILYQAVTGGSYAYELRFDVDLGGLSNQAGSGSFDSVRLVVYEGDSAAALTPATATKQQVLIEGNASGLTALVPNAQYAANPMLGPGYVSVVVEIFSSSPAIAPAMQLFNTNGQADSVIGVSNVRLIAVDRGRLSNISNRGPVGTGPNRMIVGFVVSGAGKKAAVVRGAGPWLGALNVPNSLQDPSMQLKTLAGTVLASNDDWEIGNNRTELIDAMTRVGAWQLPFADGSKDSAIFQNAGGGLPGGQYSVVVTGNNLTGDQSQIAIAEVYDYDAFGDGATELVNISNRGKTSQGAGAQIPGFVITGNRGRIVLIRVVGPSLASFVTGTLDDPKLTLLQGNDVVETNDDYGDAINADQILAASERVGAFALEPGGKDAAILMALQPGVYTAKAQVKNAGESGVVLVEVYMVSNTRPAAALRSVFVSTAGSTTLPMDEILNPVQDAEGDILAVASYTQPLKGEISEDLDGALVYTNELGFIGQTMFRYTLTDGEYESAPGTIGLNVAPPGSKLWVGGTSVNFSDPANWAGGQVPGANDDVWIVPAEPTEVNINQATELKSLRVGGIASQVTLKMQSGQNLTTTGPLEVAAGSSLNMSNGTLTTGQNARILGTLNWTGGTMNGAGSTVIENGAVANLSNSLLLTGNRGFLNRGTVNQTGYSYLRTNGGSNSTITNAAGAVWNADIQNGYYIAYSEDSASTLNFANAGRLVKNGSGTNYLGNSSGPSPVTNTGIIDVRSGTLQFEGLGTSTHSGTTLIAEGAAVLYNRGTHNFPTGAAVTGGGSFSVGTGTVSLTDSMTLPKLSVANGTFTYNGNLTVGAFSQSGGTITGNGNLTVTDTAEWTGNTIQAGAGTTVIAATATATMEGTHALDSNRKFTNNGTFTQNGYTYFRTRGGSTSTMTNAAGANWNVNVINGLIFAYSEDTSSVLNFVNAGTLTKQGAALANWGYSQGETRITNTGSVLVTDGTLQIDGNGASTHSGTLNLADGSSAVFLRGNHAFPSGAVISGDGTFQVSGVAAVTIADNESLPRLTVTAGTLTYNGTLSVGVLNHSGGTISGAGNMTITDSAEWSGNTIQAGAGTTIIAADATATMTGTHALDSNRKFTNNGDFTQNLGVNFRTRGGSTSTMTNAAGATWNVNSAANYTFAYSEDSSSILNFVNAGTLTKGGVGLVYWGYSQGETRITNTGSIIIAGGNLQFEGAGVSTHGGTLDVADGAFAIFNRGTHTFPAGAVVSGDGTFYVAGVAAVTVTDNETLPRLTVTAGSLTYNGTLSIGVLTHSGGTISGAGNMTITGSAEWSGNTVQSGAGTTVIANTATATMTGTNVLEANRKFTNIGDFTQNLGVYFKTRGGSNSTMTNAAGANWNVNAAANYTFAYSEDSSSILNFVNAGTLTKGGVGLVYWGYSQGETRITNTGSIVVAGGNLQFEGNGASTYGGTLDVADGAFAVFNRGTHTFPTGAVISGDGTFYVAGVAAVTITDNETLPRLTVTAGSLTYNGTLSIGALSHSGGTISGAGNMTITGSADWTGNTFQAGAGTTIIANGAAATMTGSNALDGNRGFTNNGTFTQTGGCYFRTRGGSTSTITNASGANWNVNVAPNYNVAYSEDGSSTLNFVNAGTLTKQGSGLVYWGSGSGETKITNTGLIVISGGNLQFEGFGASTHGGTLSMADGTFAIFNRGTHTFPNGADITGNGTFYVTGVSDVTLVANDTLAALTVASGTLTYNGTLSVGAFVQSAGTISGAGNLTITGTADWSSSGVQTGAGTTIIANGATATMTGSHYLNGNRDFTNNGIFTQTGAVYFRTNGNSNTTITNGNGATWNMNIAAGYRSFYCEGGSDTLAVINNGTLTRSIAGLFYMGYSTGTNTLTNNGTIDFSVGTVQLDFNTVTLAGAGTVRLTTDGTTKPMTRPGSLGIGGTLQVVLASGYSPANGTTVRLIDYSSKTGTFSTITPPAGRTVSPTYAANGLDVTIN
ncbi:MAG: cadherin-like domain-containing protein [Opitutaceae bacterium]